MATIAGAHMIVYSADADADRIFLRDVLGFPHVDVGDGWLIFALPASEVAVHPADTSGNHEIYLMVDDIAAFVAEMTNRGVNCTPPQDQGWGILTQLSLPGGGVLGIYQPRHARPTWSEPARRKPAKPRTSTAKSRKAMPKRRVAASRKVAKPARRKRGRTRR
jgi:catechol 2,3-dioxygenase-like lactoylglutathione lyase family enzyme